MRSFSLIAGIATSVAVIGCGVLHARASASTGEGEPQSGRAEPSAGGSLMDMPVAQRVPAIIQGLADVKGVVNAQYRGEVVIVNDPVFSAALQTGAPMLEPLLKCAETDRRDSHAVKYIADRFGPSRGPTQRTVKVRELAFFLISDLTGISAWRYRDDGMVDLASLRSVVHDTNGLTIPQILLRALADDGVDKKIWVDIGHSLTQPRYGDIIYPPNTGRVPKYGEQPPPMVGEPLRGKSRPQLTALLGLRAQQCMSNAGTGQDQPDYTSAAVDLAGYLAKWDARGGLPIMRSLYNQLSKVAGPGGAGGWVNWPAEAQNLLGLLLKYRIMAGDETAFQAYEHWLADQPGPAEHQNPYAAFRTLLLEPQWGDKVAGRLLLGPNSRWSPERELRNGGLAHIQGLLRTTLTSLPAVRECLIECLGDRTAIGTVWRVQSGAMGIRLKQMQADSWGMEGLTKPDRRDPAPNVKVPVRVCDVTAMLLTCYQKAPAFRPYWSVKERDGAIREVVDFVRSRGPSLPESRPYYMLDFEP